MRGDCPRRARPAASRRTPSFTSTSRAARSQPLPIAMPDFAGGDGQVAQQITQVLSADLERSGLFKPIDPKAFVDKDAATRIPPRFGDWRVINAQALVTGNADVEGGRAPPGRFPPVGRVRRAAAHRPALHHDAAELAAHRAHHRRRDLQAHHRRGRLFRHAHRLYRRKRAARTAASSGSPSWTRTAPTITT